MNSSNNLILNKHKKNKESKSQKSDLIILTVKKIKDHPMLENTTVWEQIAYNQHVRGGSTTITFGESIWNII